MLQVRRHQHAARAPRRPTSQGLAAGEFTPIDDPLSIAGAGGRRLLFRHGRNVAQIVRSDRRVSTAAARNAFYFGASKPAAVTITTSPASPCGALLQCPGRAVLELHAMAGAARELLRKRGHHPAHRARSEHLDLRRLRRAVRHGKSCAPSLSPVDGERGSPHSSRPRLNFAASASAPRASIARSEPTATNK